MLKKDVSYSGLVNNNGSSSYNDNIDNNNNDNVDICISEHEIEGFFFY